MKMIVGLGNPGDKYLDTKHNIGFWVVDELLKSNNQTMTDQKFRADFTIWHNPPAKTLIVKPFTYMNLSGEAVLPLMSYYGINMDDLVVVYDDMDLEPGKIRLRPKGSSGGHNGMKSIINMLGSDEFKRIKIGVGRPSPGWKVVDHVLAPFKKEDQDKINSAVTKAVSALEEFSSGQDWNKLMNNYNG